MADAAERPESSSASAEVFTAQGATIPWRPRTLHRISRRFVRLSGGRRFLLLQAVCWLALSRLALVFVPFRHLAARFGRLASPAAATDSQRSVLGEAERDLVKQVSWAVTRAARYVPFRAVCLPQAIAAQVMLRRRGIASVMRFGVAKNPGEALAAHAWLDAGGQEVTGYPVGPEYVEVARFL